MKANATRIEHVEVDISEHEISTLIRNGDYAEITTLLYGAKQAWIAKIGYTGYIYIKDGNWIKEWEEGGMSHSWTETKELSKVTPKEQAIWDHFEALAEALVAYR